ncbi:hypothetical protein JTP77_038450, partial [Streptomyces sp. S9]|nr:hypothetical protein [Streptomyces sp. S9]
MSTDHKPYGAVFSHQLWDLSSLILNARLADALERGIARYPIHRSLRLAARTQVDAMFDDLATQLGLNAHRPNGRNLLLDGEGVFVDAHAGSKADY